MLAAAVPTWARGRWIRGPCAWIAERRLAEPTAAATAAGPVRRIPTARSAGRPVATPPPTSAPSKGTCTNGACTSPAASSCAPYKCNGTACGNTCATSNDCAAPNICQMASCGKKGLGQICARADECASNFCAQGVCCNSACTATCQSCNCPGVGGQLHQRASGNVDPDARCAAQPTSTCGRDGTCNGSGGCRMHPPTTQCAAPSLQRRQRRGRLVLRRQRHLPAGATQACAPFRCNSATGACFSSCDASSQCVPPNQCSAASAARRPTAARAARGPSACPGICTEGVCCNDACAGSCRSCTVGGSVGHLHERRLGAWPIPKAMCAVTPATSCGTDGTCNGSGGCRNHPSGTPCRDASCANGVATLAASVQRQRQPARCRRRCARLTGAAAPAAPPAARPAPTAPGGVHRNMCTRPRPTAPLRRQRRVRLEPVRGGRLLQQRLRRQLRELHGQRQRRHLLAHPPAATIPRTCAGRPATSAATPASATATGAASRRRPAPTAPTPATATGPGPHLQRQRRLHRLVDGLRRFLKCSGNRAPPAATATTATASAASTCNAGGQCVDCTGRHALLRRPALQPTKQQCVESPRTCTA
jgi:hypothetical protein